MTQEEIYNIVINTKWEDTTLKFSSKTEMSEMVAFYNDNVSFVVHAIRLKENKNKYSLVVKQIIPNEKFDIDLNDIDIDWNNNNLKSMKVSEMIKCPNIHNEFLKKNF
jgi:hypothetical protein